MASQKNNKRKYSECNFEPLPGDYQQRKSQLNILPGDSAQKMLEISQKKLLNSPIATKSSNSKLEQLYPSATKKEENQINQFLNSLRKSEKTRYSISKDLNKQPNNNISIQEQLHQEEESSSNEEVKTENFLNKNLFLNVKDIESVKYIDLQTLQQLQSNNKNNNSLFLSNSEVEINEENDNIINSTPKFQKQQQQEECESSVKKQTEISNSNFMQNESENLQNQILKFKTPLKKSNLSTSRHVATPFPHNANNDQLQQSLILDQSLQQQSYAQKSITINKDCPIQFYLNYKQNQNQTEDQELLNTAEREQQFVNDIQLCSQMQSSLQYQTFLRNQQQQQQSNLYKNNSTNNVILNPKFQNNKKSSIQDDEINFHNYQEFLLKQQQLPANKDEKCVQVGSDSNMNEEQQVEATGTIATPFIIDNEMIKKYKEEYENQKLENAKLSEKIQKLEQEKSEILEKTQEKQNEIEVKKKESLEFEIQQQIQQEIIKSSDQARKEQENLMEKFKSENEENKKQLQDLQQKLEEKEKQISKMKNQFHFQEQTRIKLYDELQQQRGNLRIFCRIKPVFSITCTSSEAQAQSQTVLYLPEQKFLENNDQEEGQKLIFKTIEVHDKKNNNKVSQFYFDRVFEETAEQETIFEEIKPFVQSTIDGNNCCILAYGQTGSGKTYTMEGPNLAKTNQIINDYSGILPRAVDFIFKEKQRLNIQDKQFEFSIAVIEIYNDDLTDLQNPQKKISLTTSIEQKVEIQNLTYEKVNKIEDLIQVLKKASSTRVTEKTIYNERSSRSHCIYIMKIEYKNEKKTGLLHIVDLAGSERCQTQAPISAQSSDQKKTNLSANKKKDLNDSISQEKAKKIQTEAGFINKSLTTLGRIIRILSNQKDQKQIIPYRECNLTRLLQECLSSNGKTIMFINVCPLEENISQTKESLKFSSKASL